LVTHFKTTSDVRYVWTIFWLKTKFCIVCVQNQVQGVNFTSILCRTFTRSDPKSVKKTVKLSIFFTLSGSTSVKAVRRTLMKLTQDLLYVYGCPIYVNLLRTQILTLHWLTSFGYVPKNIYFKPFAQAILRDLGHTPRPKMFTCALRSVVVHLPPTEL